MVCKQCGKELSPRETVCPQCGAPVEEAGRYPASGPLESARSSPLFLAAVVCQSVVVLFQLLALAGSSGLMSLGNLMGLVISGVTLAGLWMVWCSGLNLEMSPWMDTGLKLLQGATLAQLILAAVLMGIGCLAAVVIAVAGGAVMDSPSMHAALANAGLPPELSGMLGAGVFLVLLVALAATVVLILFFLYSWRGVKLARASLAAGRLVGLPSLYVAVVCFVMAAVGLVGLVVSPGNILSGLANIGAKLLFGLVILQLREQTA